MDSKLERRLCYDNRKPTPVLIPFSSGRNPIYWPTEYRKVVCAIAAQALWDHYREDFSTAAKPGESAGDAIRRKFKQWFGRSIQTRWFN
jgi:hypothetical protein